MSQLGLDYSQDINEDALSESSGEHIEKLKYREAEEED
jgi:hypothetical protein